MTDSTRKLLWVGRWILQVPAYLVTNYLVRTAIVLVYRLLLRAGATITNNPLIIFPLGFSFVSGILAGLLAVLAFRLFMLLPKTPAVVESAPWKKAQAWTWLLAATWFLYGVLQWWSGHRTHSVLSTSASGLNLSDLYTVFFGSACDLVHGTFGGCLPQLGYSSPLLGCIGYSLAVFVPMQWLKKRSSSHAVAGTSDSE